MIFLVTRIQRINQISHLDLLGQLSKLTFNLVIKISSSIKTKARNQISNQIELLQLAKEIN